MNPSSNLRTSTAGHARVSKVALERAPRLLIVTSSAGLAGNVRQLAEANGWLAVPTSDAGATAEMIACSELVVVDVEMGIGLIKRLASHAGQRLAVILGGWDVRATDLSAVCTQFLHYPLREGELVTLLARTEARQV